MEALSGKWWKDAVGNMVPFCWQYRSDPSPRPGGLWLGGVGRLCLLSTRCRHQSYVRKFGPHKCGEQHAGLKDKILILALKKGVQNGVQIRTQQGQMSGHLFVQNVQNKNCPCCVLIWGGRSADANPSAASTSDGGCRGERGRALRWCWTCSGAWPSRPSYLRRRSYRPVL